MTTAPKPSRSAKDKPAPRICPVPLCGAVVKPRMLMCAPCWRRIPRRDRMAFYKVARDPQTGAGGYWRAVEAVVAKSAEMR